MGRRDLLLLFGLAALTALWGAFEALSGYSGGLSFLAPAVIVALPLLLGRYLVEDGIAELARRFRRRSVRGHVRGPRTCGALRATRRAMIRGGALVGSAPAGRPPPAFSLA